MAAAAGLLGALAASFCFILPLVLLVSAPAADGLAPSRNSRRSSEFIVAIVAFPTGA